MGELLKTSQSGGKLSPCDIEANFDDLHPPLNDQQVNSWASRCLFCYDAPCITACPTAIDIPRFIRQIATDNVIGAAKTILSANIMGGTCARACPTEILCEQQCVLNTGEQEPIEIGALQRHAVDHLMDSAKTHPFKRAANTGKTIAVIGAGPAGLACAHELARLGHDVMVFEARAKAGGLNEYGLAAYKMAGDFAAKETKFITDIGGITIKTGQALGRDFSLQDLQDNYDAVFIGIGLTNMRNLGIAGEDLSGVSNALDFIETIRQTSDLSTLDPGEDVVIIGGGNTAIDAAVQAKRLGVNTVTLAYRRGAEQMGATNWEQDLAAKNGVIIKHWAKPVEIVGSGHVQAVRFERTQLLDGALSGTGDMFDLQAGSVLKAVGQTLVSDDLNVLDIRRGKILVDASGMTSVAGVYAGGDCIASGEDLTVQAVADGKNSALEMHKMLEG
ncbi:MAG: dihydropyrimidine dehydrogenase [Robiginitomaculum sp.]|nr:MAG: dihydropyrimidine dehydrogenase [Robiginitomaculum sp.]